MEKPCYSCRIPLDMIEVPHLIFLDGVLIQPGRENDYVLEMIDNTAYLHVWNPEICNYDEKLICIVKLNTAERWAYSSKEGVYVDTRKDESFRKYYNNSNEWS